MNYYSNKLCPFTIDSIEPIGNSFLAVHAYITFIYFAIDVPAPRR